MQGGGGRGVRFHLMGAPEAKHWRPILKTDQGNFVRAETSLWVVILCLRLRWEGGRGGVRGSGQGGVGEGDEGSWVAGRERGHGSGRGEPRERGEGGGKGQGEERITMQPISSSDFEEGR